MIRYFLVLFAFGIFCRQVNSASQHTFRHYGANEGICDAYVYSLAQSGQGFLYLGTGEGLCRFDGFRFNQVRINDSVDNVLVSALYTDENKQLWVGYNDGTVTTLAKQGPMVFQADDAFSGKVIGFVGLPEGVLALSQSGKGRLFGTSGVIKGLGWPEEGILVTALTQQKGLLIAGTSMGVAVAMLKDNKLEIVSKPALTEYFTIKAIGWSSHYNGYLVAAEDEGVFLLQVDPSGKSVIKPLPEFLFLSAADIQSIYQDSERRLWIATFGQGAYCVSFDNETIAYKRYDSTNGLKSDFVKGFYQDRTGNLWVATYGEGVLQLLDEAFTFYGGKSASAIATNGQKVFAGGDGQVIVSDIMGNTLEIIGRNQGLPAEMVTALYNDGATLWIGTANSGVYYRSHVGGAVRKLDYADNLPGKSVVYINGSPSDLWLATHNGVYRIDKETLKSENFTTQENLPHNYVQHIYVDGKGQAWVSAKGKGPTLITKGGEVLANQLFSAFAEIEYTGMTIDSAGHYWVATYGQGVYRVTGDTIIQYTVNNGLKSNYCYAIEYDEHSKIWIGHRQGVSNIDVANGAVSTFVASKGFEGDVAQNGIHLSSAGQIWFATSQGLVAYNPSKARQNTTPPQLNLVAVRINDVEYPLEGTEILLPYDIYKMRFEFIGLDFRAPDEVRYQVMFKGKGFDTDFGELTADQVAQFSNVRDGIYELRIRAFNNEKVPVEQDLVLKIRVKKPFWKTIWFVFLVIGGVAGSVYLYIRERERKQKALQEFLQRSLDERTREVVEQKEEIELKNRDITDSINYAQRIQASILPSISKLQDNFSGSFVFYQPRDIVSGDFYWFDRINDRKFVIVCADSTGHGVPGAFMSIIGTTLIKDICLRDQNESPADILIKLDNSLRNTLNQNLEVERSNDGMDIIVCEFDIVTNELRYASAMRPMIVYRNGEEIYVKGSRSSVGGHFSKEDKDFEEGSIQLSKGDIIYMFSDGYTDQFGGPMGKKFKIVRLKNLLKDIYELPMEAQYNHVVNTFGLWKQNLAQVDDVLFMGIRI